MLVSYDYDDLGRRASTDRENGVTTSYTYGGSGAGADEAGRLTSLVQDLSGATHDQTFDFAYNATGQIVSRGSATGLYDYDELSNVTIESVANILNQITCIGDNIPACTGGVSTAHDDRGNMTDDGPETYAYDTLNRMTSTGAGGAFTYDATSRLYQAGKGGTYRRFLYDGAHIIAEYNTSGTVLKRYVRAPRPRRRSNHNLRAFARGRRGAG